MAEPAIDARRLFAVHGAVTGSVVALQGLSLRVEPGEFLPSSARPAPASRR